MDHVSFFEILNFIKKSFGPFFQYNKILEEELLHFLPISEIRGYGSGGEYEDYSSFSGDYEVYEYEGNDYYMNGA